MTASSAATLEAARSMLGLSVPDLWVDYLALGGCATPATVAAFLSGDRRLGDYDHDLLTQALNERFLDSGDDHPLPYAYQTEPDEP